MIDKLVPLVSKVPVLLLVLKGPALIVGGAFLAITIPVHYFFFKDEPKNSIEKIDEYLIKEISGKDIDLKEQEERLDKVIDEIIKPHPVQME